MTPAAPGITAIVIVCSFCLKSQNEGIFMVQGDTASIICEECARGAVAIIDKHILDKHMKEKEEKPDECTSADKHD